MTVAPVTLIPFGKVAYIIACFDTRSRIFDDLYAIAYIVDFIRDHV